MIEPGRGPNGILTICSDSKSATAVLCVHTAGTAVLRVHVLSINVNNVNINVNDVNNVNFIAKKHLFNLSHSRYSRYLLCQAPDNVIKVNGRG